eukprot:3249746-Prymnesium_polylepis.1
MSERQLLALHGVVDLSSSRIDLTSADESVLIAALKHASKIESLCVRHAEVSNSVLHTIARTTGKHLNELDLR